MMKRSISILCAVAALTACASPMPETQLQNPATGEYVTCGGENLSGNKVVDLLSRNINRTDAMECVEEYQKIGFKKVP